MEITRKYGKSNISSTATVPKCDNAPQQLNGNLYYWKQYFAVIVGSAGVSMILGQDRQNSVYQFNVHCRLN